MARNEKLSIYPSDNPLYSQRFELIEDFGILTFVGMQDGDTACIETFVGDECDGEWVGIVDSGCGTSDCMCYPQNQMLVTVPARYRVVMCNKFDNHLTDPAWFENLKIYNRVVSSNVDLTHLLKGNSNMSCCGLSISDVKQVVEGCIAAIPSGSGGVDTNTFVASVEESGIGWLITMSNGVTFPFTIDALGALDLTGNDLSIDVAQLVTDILADAGALADLQAALGGGGGVDTNTFATFDGTVITFADGSTLDISTIGETERDAIQAQLDAHIVTNAAEHAALQAEIDANEAAIAALDAANTAEHAALQAEIDANEAAIAALDATNAAEHAALQAEIDALETDLATLTTTNAAEHAALQAEIDALEDRVTVLENMAGMITSALPFDSELMVDGDNAAGLPGLAALLAVGNWTSPTGDPITVSAPVVISVVGGVDTPSTMAEAQSQDEPMRVEFTVSDGIAPDVNVVIEYPVNQVETQNTAGTEVLDLDLNSGVDNTPLLSLFEPVTPNVNWDIANLTISLVGAPAGVSLDANNLVIDTDVLATHANTIFTVEATDTVIVNGVPVVRTATKTIDLTADALTNNLVITTTNQVTANDPVDVGYTLNTDDTFDYVLYLATDPDPAAGDFVGNPLYISLGSVAMTTTGSPTSFTAVPTNLLDTYKVAAISTSGGPVAVGPPFALDTTSAVAPFNGSMYLASNADVTSGSVSSIIALDAPNTTLVQTNVANQPTIASGVISFDGSRFLVSDYPAHQAFDTKTSLPEGNGSDVGEGFGIRDIIKLPNGNWAVSSDGRSQMANGDPADGTVAIMSADFLTVIAEYKLTDYIPGAVSVMQGMGLDSSGNLWIAAKDISTVLSIDPTTGLELSQLVLPFEPNGMTYDTIRDELVVTQEGQNEFRWVDPVTAAVTQIITTNPTSVDQLFFDADHGANGAVWYTVGVTNGSVDIIDLTSQETVRIGDNFNGITSPEGIWYDRDTQTLYLGNLGYFINGVSGDNAVYTYKMAPPVERQFGLSFAGNVPSGGDTDYILSYGRTDENVPAIGLVRPNGSDSLRLVMRVGTVATVVDFPASDLTIDANYWVEVDLDANSAELFVDGVSLETVTFTAPTISIFTPDGGLVVGAITQLPSLAASRHITMDLRAAGIAYEGGQRAAMEALI